MRPIIAAACLFIASASAADAQSRASLPAPAAAEADQFLSLLKQGKASEAFHGAFHDVEPQMGSQTIDTAGAQTAAMLKTFGEIIDWSPYQTDAITPHMIRQTYFVRCSAIPLFATIQFYEAVSGWHIVDIQLNTYTNGKNAGYYDAVQATQ